MNRRRTAWLLLRVCLAIAVAIALCVYWRSPVERALGFRLPTRSNVLCPDSGGFSPATYLQWVVESRTGSEQRLREALGRRKKELPLPDSISTVQQLIQQVCPEGARHVSAAKYCFSFTYDSDPKHVVDVTLLVGDEWEVMVVKRQRKMGAE